MIILINGQYSRTTEVAGTRVGNHTGLFSSKSIIISIIINSIIIKSDGDSGGAKRNSSIMQRSSQITTNTWVFYRPDALLLPNQQCRTEGKLVYSPNSEKLATSKAKPQWQGTPTAPQKGNSRYPLQSREAK